MRILWSIHLYPKLHNCGSELVAHNVNKYLISKGHECRVILHQYNGLPYTYEGVEIFPATGLLDAYRWADCLMTHLDFTQFTMIMAREAKKPLVHFIHNDIQYSSVMAGGKGNYAIYNSDWIAKAVNYPHPHITLHPPCDIKQYNVNDDPIYNEYITLISLNERKGGYLFKKIAEAMPHNKFLGVIGSYDNPGPLKLSQQQIIDMMPSNVTIVPNSPDILSVYKKTRLLLMPSDYESWGRTATEAMCNGIPVICTPTPGLKENCGEAADYVGTAMLNTNPGEAQVKTGTVYDWMKAINQFDDDCYYRQKSVLCRKRAAELDPEKELAAVEKFLIDITQNRI